MPIITSAFGQQQVSSTLTLEQQGDRLTGRVENARFGTTEISEGSVTGNGFRFTTNTNVGGQTVTLTYEGTVSGNQMNGTVTTPRGARAFSGTRNP